MRRLRVPATRVLYRVRTGNVLVGHSFLGRLSGHFSRRVVALRGHTCRITNRRFGLNSPGRLNRVLFRGLNIPNNGGAGSNRCSANRTMLSGVSRPLISVALRCHKLSGLGDACASTLSGITSTRASHIRADCRRTLADANHLSSASPGLRGVPVHATANHLVHRTFVTPRNHIVLTTSCSRVRLHLVTRFSNSRGLAHTFGRKLSVRATATTRMLNGTIRRIDTARHHGTGTVGFNLLCNVDTFKLTGRLRVDHGRTRSCVSVCFRHCPDIGSCVVGAHTDTCRGNCIRAVLNHGLCAPSVGRDGHVIGRKTRHTTVGTPLRNSTTSLVGLTVITISGMLPGGRTGVLLRIRSRLIFRISDSEITRVDRLVGSTVRGMLSRATGSVN